MLHLCDLLILPLHFENGVWDAGCRNRNIIETKRVELHRTLSLTTPLTELDNLNISFNHCDTMGLKQFWAHSHRWDKNTTLRLSICESKSLNRNSNPARS